MAKERKCAACEGHHKLNNLSKVLVNNVDQSKTSARFKHRNNLIFCMLGTVTQQNLPIKL